ncbi:DUF4396 domain-containing protein [Streptomyces geysiriensis]|uniref:DUF4396 domain-containing protein n=1 Tax=Streptomyces geysiriensis TaxID=68207 RepID=UPI001C7DF85C|nr:DUF4396 domain-containing protein [Streptomyces geysiriensis]MBX4174324.1 DUF4396 domain-containing protein [Streptomyces geysiriensis]
MEHHHHTHQEHHGHGQAHHGHHGHGQAHQGHQGHQQREQHGATWATAVRATLHCLTGCAIGEILGMVIGTALMWGNVPTMALAIGLAFVFGYSFTLFAVVRAGVSLKAAVKVALAADTVSIAVMELVDNGIIAVTPGAMDAHLSDGLFWYALLGGFAVAFLITTPVNKWMIGRGKGHAVVHAYH